MSLSKLISDFAHLCLTTLLVVSWMAAVVVVCVERLD